MSNQTKNTKTYKIEKITDIFEIPRDRFDDFLVDFKAYYEAGFDIAELLTVTGKALKIPAEVVKGGMTWIDDGRNDIKIQIDTAHTALNKLGDK
jgi:hypothetical protein